MYAQSMSSVPPDYMRNQVEINEKMRAVVINWLMEVQFGSYASSICCQT